MSKSSPPDLDIFADDIAPLRPRTLRTSSFVMWGAVLVFVVFVFARDRTPINGLMVIAFTGLFLGIHAQLWLQGTLTRRSFRHTILRLRNTSYISDSVPLPNRNYLLAELRREMATSRDASTPFTLVHISLENFASIRERRGEEFAERSLRSLASLLRRVTRNSDFLSHLEDSNFVTILVECKASQARLYLRRIPGSLAISDGRQMFDIGIVARVHEYDLEGVYATDVLREAENAVPLHRENQRELNSAA